MTTSKAEKTGQKGDILTVWLTSLFGSAFVSFSVVAGIGYSMLTGFLYFIGLMICFPLFWYCLGYPLYPGQKTIDLDDR